MFEYFSYFYLCTYPSGTQYFVLMLCKLYLFVICLQTFIYIKSLDQKNGMWPLLRLSYRLYCRNRAKSWRTITPVRFRCFKSQSPKQDPAKTRIARLLSLRMEGAFLVNPLLSVDIAWREMFEKVGSDYGVTTSPRTRCTTLPSSGGGKPIITA